VVRNGQVPRGPSPVVWDAESAGASGQRPAGRGSGGVGRILPPYLCRWPKVAEVLVWYLRGTVALRPALETLLVGDEHPGG
jgi:hypothetical protein